MKVLIQNNGCDDTTSTVMELEQNELYILTKFAKENNKNSDCACQPKISIYTKFQLIKNKKNSYKNSYYDYYKIDYESDLVKE